MKQYISLDQFNELSETEKEKFKLRGVKLFLWRIYIWWLFHKPMKKQDLSGSSDWKI